MDEEAIRANAEQNSKNKKLLQNVGEELENMREEARRANSEQNIKNMKNEQQFQNVREQNMTNEQQFQNVREQNMTNEEQFQNVREEALHNVWEETKRAKQVETWRRKREIETNRRLHGLEHRQMDEDSTIGQSISSCIGRGAAPCGRKRKDRDDHGHVEEHDGPVEEYEGISRDTNHSSTECSQHCCIM